jgi:hypothetical protein
MPLLLLVLNADGETDPATATARCSRLSLMLRGSCFYLNHFASAPKRHSKNKQHKSNASELE